MVRPEFISHCGRVFAYKVQRGTHQRDCTICQDVATTNEEMRFQDRPPRTYVSRDDGSDFSEEPDATDGGDDEIPTSGIFLDHPQQMDLLARLLQQYKVHDYIFGLCYFEPEHPPPYYINSRNDVAPPLVSCKLRVAYRDLYVGYVRESEDKILETWLRTDDHLVPYVEYRTELGKRTKFADTTVYHDGECAPLMPRQALDLVFYIFKARMRRVALEIARLNETRRIAYESVQQRLTPDGT